MAASLRTAAVVARRGATAAVLALALGALLLSLALRADLVRTSRVLSGSMAPTLRTGALIASVPVEATDIEVGELVTFAPPAPFGTPGGAPIVHRVVEVDRAGGDVLVRTKGDANATVDPWTLNASRSTVFRVGWSSLAAGRVTDVAGRAGRSVVVSVVVGAAALHLLVALWRPGRRSERTSSRSPRHLRAGTS